MVANPFPSPNGEFFICTAINDNQPKSKQKKVSVP